MKPEKQTISASPRSRQKRKNPLGLFWRFRPSTSNYNLIQELGIRHKTRDRAERQFTQMLLLDGGQKKPAGKKPEGKSRQEIWVGTMNHGSNSQ